MWVAKCWGLFGWGLIVKGAKTLGLMPWGLFVGGLCRVAENEYNNLKLRSADLISWS